MHHAAAQRAVQARVSEAIQEFLNPFFEALGWDMVNRNGYAFNLREVIHEDSLEIEDETKAPDYAFKVGTERKFFVEAKKPYVKLETNAEAAYQLRSYAWSAGLPLSILTDFEEFAVYDCRFTPKHGDKPSVGRVSLSMYDLRFWIYDWKRDERGKKSRWEFYTIPS